MTDRPTDWPIDRLTDWLIDWLTDWLRGIGRKDTDARNIDARVIAVLYSRRHLYALRLAAYFGLLHRFLSVPIF